MKFSSKFCSNNTEGKVILMSSNKTVLVTGGAGFIGSNLCRRLLKENSKVICMDNFYTSKKENIEELLYDKNFNLIEQDVIIPFNIKADEIYHFAAPASPVFYQKDPIFTLKTIIIGTLNALECARINNSRILNASTSEIYGEPEVHPQKEDYYGNVNINGIRACYDEGKRCGETLCSDYRRHFGVDTKIIRIFNTYGPYMDKNDGRVVSEFITCMLNNQPVKVHGSGTQTRSFCYIDDLIEGIIRMMNSDASGPVNLGNAEEISILQLVNIISEVIGIDPQIVFKDLPLDDPTKRKPDITKATQTFGWKPSIDIRTGIYKTVRYFESINKRRLQRCLGISVQRV
jgi:UDP-glucuronate decarboxylase